MYVTCQFLFCIVEINYVQNKYVNIVFHSILHVFNFLFSGCIADRDFTPGVSVLANIVEAIHSSYKVILVLTDHFVSSQWCECEANQAIIRSLGLNDVQDQDCNSNCVIPVLLEECKIPIKLQHLTYSDMTIEQDFVFEMRRLKRALLPEVQ